MFTYQKHLLNKEPPSKAMECKREERKRVQKSIVVWRAQELAGRHSVTGVGEEREFDFQFPLLCCPPLPPC